MTVLAATVQLPVSDSHLDLQSGCVTLHGVSMCLILHGFRGRAKSDEDDVRAECLSGGCVNVT